MDDDPRQKWALFSGLTRREQRVLIFLILLIAAGLAYEQYRGGWRREALTLHRAPAGAPQTAATPAVVPTPRGRREVRVTTTTIESLLDINKTSVEQLDELPGIGPTRAAAIVRFRETHGPFKRIEDLKQIPGIGDKTLAGFRPFLKPLDTPTTRAVPSWPSVTPGSAKMQPSGIVIPQPTPLAPVAPETASKVNINLATIEELTALDGIGPILARRIVDYRQQHGPFRTPADIQKVYKIGPGIYSKIRDRLTVEPPRR